METIRRILMNRAYLGEFHYGQHIIKLPQLAILSCDLWEEAQKRRKKNFIIAKRNRRHENLLVGYFRCVCGGAMVSENRTKGQYSYYRCCRRVQYHLHKCRERYVRADKADPIVWDWLSGVLANDQTLEIGLNRMIERREIELSPKRDRLKAVKEFVEHYEQQAKNLAKGLAKAKNETVLNALNDELEKVGKTLGDLVDERELLIAYIGQGEFTPDEVTKIKRIASELREELRSPDFETKRYVIDKLNLRAQLRHDEQGRWLDVTCELKLDLSSLLIDTSVLRIM